MKNTFLTGQIFLITLALVVLHFFSASAQNKTWGAGPELGLSFSKFSGSVDNQEFKTGFVGGGHVTYSTRPTYGVTLKMLYHQRGSQEEIAGEVHQQALHYLEFPLLARYFLTPSGKFRPNIFLGPSASFLLAVKEKTGDEDFKSVSAEEREEYNGFDLGLSAGVGLNYLIGWETRLLFDARYTYGITDVYKPEGLSAYNRGLAFTLGLSFGITKKPLD